MVRLERPYPHEHQCQTVDTLVTLGGEKDWCMSDESARTAKIEKITKRLFFISIAQFYL